jgi:hypothetical protein
MSEITEKDKKFVVEAMNCARRAANRGRIQACDINITKARELLEERGSSLAEQGYSDEDLDTLKVMATHQEARKLVEMDFKLAPNYIQHGAINAFTNLVDAARRDAKQRGTDLAELGYSEQKIQAMERETLINDAAKNIYCAVKFGSDYHVGFGHRRKAFSDYIMNAQARAEQIGAKLIEIIEPNLIEAAKKSYCDLGMEMDGKSILNEALGIKPPSLRKRFGQWALGAAYAISFSVDRIERDISFRPRNGL